MFISFHFLTVDEIKPGTQPHHTPAAITSCNRLNRQTVNQNKTILPRIAFLKYFVTVGREVLIEKVDHHNPLCLQSFMNQILALVEYVTSFKDMYKLPVLSS